MAASLMVARSDGGRTGFTVEMRISGTAGPALTLMVEPVTGRQTSGPNERIEILLSDSAWAALKAAGDAELKAARG